MSANHSVLLLRDDALIWLEPGAAQGRHLADAEQRQALLGHLQQGPHGVVFAAPGSEVRLLELAVAREERRHLQASLPFMLEESLTEDIETLHFARVPLDADHYGVAVVRRQQMFGWEQVLGDFAGMLPWVPEPLLLPFAAGEWVLVIEPDSVLIRYGDCAGTRLETALLEVFLEALVDTHEPARVVIYGALESSDRGCIPEKITCPVEWRRGGLAAALLLGEPGTRLNLRQGDFAPRLPYARWRQQWQTIAALLLVALAVHMLSGWLDYRRLQRENLALRTEIQAVYRQVNPRGAVSDVEKQLQRQLSDLKGDRSDRSFIALLAPLALSMGEGMSLASLNYSERNAELRVNLLAADFAEVESLRKRLDEAGLRAKMESSSRSGDRVRARLSMSPNDGSGT